MLENIRDKARDNLYKNLMDIGVQCEMSKRGIRADKLQNPWHRKSLGVIKINSKSPIEFINIIKQDRSKDRPPRWWYYFAVPDKSVQSNPNQTELRSIRKKTFPIFGKVKSIEWKHNNYSENLASEFTTDTDINSLAMDIGNIKIESINKDFSGYTFTGYTIEIEKKTWKDWGENRKITLNINQWKTINKIASICIN
tara:strand:+ start:111 stop:701 length:591 start_codon:yes stop_codon:yes gene_type:complete